MTKPTIESISQEIYFLVSDDEMYYIPYEKYTTNRLATWDQGNPTGIFKKGSGIPLNLLGPALTKVIQWNIDEFVDDEILANSDSNIKQKCDLKPGYLLDLRTLTIPKLLASATNESQLKYLVNLSKFCDNPLNPSDSNHPHLIKVPADQQDELSRKPIEPNLYIISWQEPLGDHKIDDFGAAQLSYISYQQLQQYQLSIEEQIDTLCIDEETKVIPYLQDYFLKTGAQLGALNPFDQPDNVRKKIEQASFSADEAAYFVCYVANVKSFSQS